METPSIEEPPVTDWDKVEINYRSGLMSKAEICRENNISIVQLNNAVETRGWAQEIISPEDEATVLQYAEQGTPRFPCDSLFDPDAVKRQVLLTAGQIVKKHREEVGRLRGVASTIMSRVEQFLADEDIHHLRFLLGKNDAIPDLIEKLSRILMRMTDMERKAYGMESLTVLPNEEEDNQVSKDIRALTERLKLITEQKAQKAEPVANADNRQDNDEISKGPVS